MARQKHDYTVYLLIDSAVVHLSDVKKLKHGTNILDEMMPWPGHRLCEIIAASPAFAIKKVSRIYKIPEECLLAFETRYGLDY